LKYERRRTIECKKPLKGSSGGQTVPIKHLYRRQYQTAGGDWSTLYYARFRDWQGKSRIFPLGSEIKAAKEALAIYEARKVKREDFDVDKVKSKQGMMIAEWRDAYLKLEEIRAKRSFDRDCDYVAVIKRLLATVVMKELGREHLFRFKSQRIKETSSAAVKKSPRPSRRASLRTSSPVCRT
jgi:hypothetical protein